jgi:hypothetical protein
MNDLSLELFSRRKNKEININQVKELINKINEQKNDLSLAQKYVYFLQITSLIYSKINRLF